MTELEKRKQKAESLGINVVAKYCEEYVEICKELKGDTSKSDELDVAILITTILEEWFKDNVTKFADKIYEYVQKRDYAAISIIVEYLEKERK